MKTTNALIALALASILAAGPVAAERADRTKPMNVEADALRYDDANQTSVFTGRVVVTKGTIVIRGAKVTVKQDPAGYHFGVVTSEAGKPAFFRQKRDGVDEFMEGEAETIEYDGRADRVKFIGRAEMRRLRGGSIADETSGALITYDNTTDQFSVDGAPGGVTPANPGGRVRATLAPRGSAAAPAGAPASAPARLRPSTSMGGERR
ncbi:MAG TPA: lipopolysaccharide transport periplasmic protein LptA [Ramlibacter sp.]